jgi:hypothetical protein
MSKFFLVFLAIFLYILVWLAAVAGVVIASGGDEEVGLVIALGTLVIFPITLFPFMQFVAKLVYRFDGEGSSVSEADLRQMILNINSLDAPVMIQEGKDGRLIATWKYVDAKWWEIFAKAGLEKVYELHMKIDGDKKVVTMIDIYKSVSWKAGPSQVRLRGGFFRGISTTYEIGKQWGIKENFELGKILDYKFNSNEIKHPIMNTILKQGWDVRFGLW